MVKKQMSVRVVADYFGFNKSSVGDYVKKVSSSGYAVPQRLKISNQNREI